MKIDKWMASNCHDPVNLDTGLIEIAETDHEQNTMRVIALLSVGMPVEDGFLSCRELLEVIHWCVEGLPDGKRRLAQLLGNDCNDYQRAVYYALAGRGAIGMLTDLKRLTDVMETRYLYSVAVEQSEMAQRVPENPYTTDKADGPLGVFDPNFTMSPLWDDVIEQASEA